MTEERRAVSEVRDIPTEIWIKVLVAVTTIAVGLIAYMGDRLIDGQDRTTNEVSKINGSLSTFDSRISRNEKDIRELNTFHSNIRKGLKP